MRERALACAMVLMLSSAAGALAQADWKIESGEKERPETLPCAIVGLRVDTDADVPKVTAAYVAVQDAEPRPALSVPQFAPLYYEALSDAAADGERAVLAAGAVETPGPLALAVEPGESNPTAVCEVVVPLAPDPAVGAPRILRVYQRNEDGSAVQLLETPLTAAGVRE